MSEPGSRSSDKIAVAIHAFYPDILEYIVRKFEEIPLNFKYYITTSKENEGLVSSLLSSAWRVYSLKVVENKGRDILPFLGTCNQIRLDGFEFVLKLHTKKSPQFRGRNEWGRDVFQKLLSPEAFVQAWDVIRTDRNLGILCPDGYYLSLSTHMGPNRNRVLAIGARLGLTEADVLRQGFVAGSMYMARLEALEPLLGLDFHAADFEPEAGQIDGTLAHALERCVGFGPLITGQRISFTSSPEKPAAFNSDREFAQARWPKSGLWSWPIAQNLRYAGRSLEAYVRHSFRGKSR